MSESIWEAPYLPVKLGEYVAIRADENSCLTLWVEGHGRTLTNEESMHLLRVLCPTQAQTDADYEQMFAALEDSAHTFKGMSDNWSNLCRYWHERANALELKLKTIMASKGDGDG